MIIVSRKFSLIPGSRVANLSSSESGRIWGISIEIFDLSFPLNFLYLVQMWPNIVNANNQWAFECKFYLAGS